MCLTLIGWIKHCKDRMILIVDLINSFLNNLFNFNAHAY
jgi:hypothetical protein